MVESVATLVEYTQWSGEIILRECAVLSDEQLKRDLGGSQGSLLRLLRHVYDAEQGWLKMIANRHLPPFDQLGGDSIGDAPETLGGLTAAWPELWSRWSGWFHTLTEDDLKQPVAARLPDGRAVSFTVADLIAHAVNHSTLHRGQMVTMLRMLGSPCQNVDLMGYLIQRQLAE
jgi:uncharacterized damage-inducible protein DinB